MKAPAVGLVLLFAGCAGGSVAHLVPAYPVQEQPAAMTEHDKDDCDRIAMTRAADRLAFQSACLLARGYRTYVALTKRGPGQAQFTVLAERQQGTEQALRDLTECAQDAGATITPRTGAQTLFVNMVSQGIAQGGMEKPFIVCMTTRGYAASRWVP